MPRIIKATHVLNLEDIIESTANENDLDPSKANVNINVKYAAYIYDHEESEKYGNPTWVLSEDIDKILTSSMETTYIIDGNDKNAYKSVIEKIEQHYPSTNEYRIKYPLLFQPRVQTSYHFNRYDGKIVLHNDESSQVNQLYKDDVFEQYVAYIKDLETLPFPSSHFSVSKHIKKQMNLAGIYVRPIKKIFEYNPVKAKKQLFLSKKKKAKLKSKHINIQVLQLVVNSLENSLSAGYDRSLAFKHSYKLDGRTYAATAYRMLFYIDCINMLYYGKPYRYLQKFQDLKDAWKNIDQVARAEFESDFINFMDIEVKVKRPPKSKIVDWSLDARHNLEIKQIFSVSGLTEKIQTRTIHQPKYP